MTIQKCSKCFKYAKNKITLKCVQETNTNQSDEYGFNTPQERFNVILEFIDENNLDPVLVMLSFSVEQFIDYGLVDYKSDKHFFRALKTLTY